MANAVGGPDETRSEVHEETRAPIEVVLSQVILYVFGVIEVLIAVRFALKLFGANAEAGFVQFIYGLSGIFMAPFNAVFGTTRFEGARFEWSALLAIAIYALLAWGLVMLVGAVSPREKASTYERVEKH